MVKALTVTIASAVLAEAGDACFLLSPEFTSSLSGQGAGVDVGFLWLYSRHPLDWEKVVQYCFALFLIVPHLV